MRRPKIWRSPGAKRTMRSSSYPSSSRFSKTPEGTEKSRTEAVEAEITEATTANV